LAKAVDHGLGACLGSCGIELEVDGTPVTGAQSTSAETSYDLEVDSGESYTATLSVSDMAGNEATAETQFAVGTDSDSSGGSGGASGGGGGGGSGGSSAPDSGTDEEVDEDEETETGAEADDADSDSADDDTDAESSTDTPVESDDTPPAASDDEDTIPGFGAGLAVLVITLCALLIARRAETVCGN